jgi:hypothetical protein
MLSPWRYSAAQTDARRVIMAYHQHARTWTERTSEPESYPQSQNYDTSYDDLEHHAKTQGFRNAHTSLGVAGHLVHMGAMLFPVLAAELINDAVKYKKAVKIGAVTTTVLYEGLYTMREMERRHKAEERAEACHQHE